MARRQTAQLELDMPDDPPTEDPEYTAPPTPQPRRPRVKPEAKSPMRNRLRHVLWMLGAMALVVALVTAFYKVDQFLASDPHFLLPGNAESHPNLVIAGTNYAPLTAITRVFLEDFERSVYLMPLGARRRALMRIDWVKDAFIARRWPNHIDVRIVERTPLAFVMLPGASQGAFETALIDDDGVILSPPPRARFHLPVVFGITRQLPVSARRARIGEVAALMKEVRAYAGQISEIDVSDPENLTITQTLGGRSVRLMLGNEQYLVRLKKFLTHYSGFSRRLPNARVFDLRQADQDRILALDGGANAR